MRLEAKRSPDRSRGVGVQILESVSGLVVEDVGRFTLTAGAWRPWCWSHGAATWHGAVPMRVRPSARSSWRIAWVGVSGRAVIDPTGY